MGTQDHTVIGTNIRRFRKIRELNQDQIAKEAGISRQAYVSIESGKTNPRFDSIVKIAAILNVSIDDLTRPLPELTTLRFRTKKTMTSREKAEREQMVILVFGWLKLYESISTRHEKNVPIERMIKKLHAGVLPVENASSLVRKELRIPENEPIRDIIGLLENSGIKVGLFSFPIRQCFGFSLGKNDGGPLICVNTHPDISIERKIFSAAHELGHVLLHPESFQYNINEENPDEEKEANTFASYFLMPAETFLKVWKKNEGLGLVDRVLAVKLYFGVSYKTVLMRLVHENLADAKIYAHFSSLYQSKYGKDLKNYYEPSAEETDLPESYEPESLPFASFAARNLFLKVKEARLAGNISVKDACTLLQITCEELASLEQEWKETTNTGIHS